MKRFWERAAAVREGADWSVMLDGKPVRLPGGAPLAVPAEPLARAIATEWADAGAAKGDEVSAEALPLTRLAATAQERVARDPGGVALAIAEYAESDLLCYRATGPDALVRREAQAWDRWLDWAADRYGARLRVTQGVIHVAQDAQALAALAAAVAAADLPALAALGVAVPALGSVVLGLAMAEGALDADSAYALSVVDAEFQAEQWGRDAEAEAAAQRVRAEVVLAGRFLALSRP